MEEFVWVVNQGTKSYHHVPGKGAVIERVAQPYKVAAYTFPMHTRVKVPLSFISSIQGIEALQIDYSPLKENFRTHTDEGKLYFDWYCPLSMIDGYGRHALAIWKGFGQMDNVEPALRGIPGMSHSQFLSSALHRSSLTVGVPAKVGIAFTLPYDPFLWDRQNLVRICLTQFETTHVPEKHVENINKCDHLIVTSSYQPPVMKRSGVKIPISVMVPGVDTDFFTSPDRVRKDDLFRVLILGALTPRKDPEGAVRAFQKASNNDSRWRLLIKTRRAQGVGEFLIKLGFPVAKERNTDYDNSGSALLDPWVYHIPFPFIAKAPADPRITIEISDSSPEQVRDMYHSHDALLWPSRGEGCGLPPLEAMSCGMEVVSSDNSGLADFVHHNHSWPIRNKGMESAGPPNGFSQRYINVFGDVGDWWLPDLEDAAYQLKRAFDAWKKGDGKGKLAAKYVRENHTLRHQAQSVVKVVEKYV